MNDVVQKLLDLLQLHALDDCLFQGSSEDLGFKNVFGGQVVGQALMAAYRTVDETRVAHSLHAYFLRAGDPDHDIIYEVTPIRDGRSFSARRVAARQHGKEILTLMVSFQTPEQGFEHQEPMVDVTGPEGIVSELEMRRRFKDLIPESRREQLTRERPIEIRPLNQVNPLNPEKQEPKKYNWFRAVRDMPEGVRWHHCVLAYASDFGLLGTSLHPHGVSFFQRGMQVASLDHAVWFHRDFRVDDWLLYAMDSPSASHGRGFNRGLIYDRSGRLVASTAQEALIRRRTD
ncbi:acyl-CoA thioesterase II [Hahella sp. HN01]|uniref:acyl-CoA thioesterase II n=1 Tax=Hahella sp. HN01 TaxID=2847262 RepID=UPI001C1F14BF|nr:acyl-CoA thioesterase II [Hahella sp. HN01]MBU6954673.1 acyl-CoA thioesterase II [Hahella sp. HN01]